MIDPKINTINIHEFKKQYDTLKPLFLIDVREESEWQNAHIPRAIHIPKDQLIARIASIVQDHKAPIYLHCRGGVRSLHAAEQLVALGYEQVYSMDGGIMAWEKAGYPVES